ncbi:unnamed protein product [Cylicocyclus nassatus]|uniref:Uncharacterized protein n=1 Tax=Cylicocyclus nassatus TaxID=53992 RepID=A0AA36H8T6_CYLNA|nr:unnamed protein product [Cylicocyclus nassatus]
MIDRMVEWLTWWHLKFTHLGSTAREFALQILISQRLREELPMSYDEKNIMVLHRLKTPREAAIWSICLYVSRSMSNDERSIVINAFDAVVARFGLRSPECKRKNTLTPSG